LLFRDSLLKLIFSTLKHRSQLNFAGKSSKTMKMRKFRFDKLSHHYKQFLYFDLQNFWKISYIFNPGFLTQRDLSLWLLSQQLSASLRTCSLTVVQCIAQHVRSFGFFNYLLICSPTNSLIVWFFFKVQ
jgi:hypothetical protein